MRLAAVVVFIVEIILSHMPGDRSGAESRWLAQATGIKERSLRRSAHVFLFAVLSLFAALGFGPLSFAFCAAWAVLDEVTKRWIPGRHCSVLDILLNLVGVAIGMLLGAG